ncbi:type VI secretion system baseplate subunit TssE [Magnetospirillum sulfuroxidans]|uniref:Type VI secretion system baseplate subunit TssE n=1 Tax=Magnetospirillum sulfuroxidans TaxID=611300 RepID=A0ABS5IC54_9PROT|nr:type VI secretion system baseplate subunit TssE [Magnetospirillum sulfuroxidans]
MAGLQPIEGGRALLFERLIDGEPGQREGKPFILHDRNGLMRSIATELERLLSTRLSVPPRALEKRQRGTLDYGIPDGAIISPADPQGCLVLAAQIQAAIVVFEPRLQDPLVSLRPVATQGNALIADIAAHLVIDGLLEPVSFAIPLGAGDER